MGFLVLRNSKLFDFQTPYQSSFYIGGVFSPYGNDRVIIQLDFLVDLIYETLQYFLITLFFIGCEEDRYYPYPCKDGGCDSVFFVDESKNSRSDENNYWRVLYQGLKYFTLLMDYSHIILATNEMFFDVLKEHYNYQLAKEDEMKENAGYINY